MPRNELMKKKKYDEFQLQKCKKYVIQIKSSKITPNKQQTFYTFYT